MVKESIRRIREKTEGMSWKEKAAYILAYYWYHILGAAAAAGLLLFLIVHFGFGEEKPLFTCVMVNQAIDPGRDAQLTHDFAYASGIEAGRLVFDSDFQISYKETQLKGINESSYEKFFFKWQNRELDAVILPESFYEYCLELGGAFRILDEREADGLPLYEDGGQAVAVKAEETVLSAYLANETGETLLLVFPKDGRHPEACREFLDWLKGCVPENGDGIEKGGT